MSLISGIRLERLQIFVPLALIQSVIDPDSSIRKQDVTTWSYLKSNSNLSSDRDASYWYTIQGLAEAMGWKKTFTSESLKRLKDEKFLRDSISHNRRRRTLFFYGSDPEKITVPIPGSLLHSQNTSEINHTDVYVWAFMRSRTKFVKYETTGMFNSGVYAKYMGIHRSMLSRSLKRLREMRFLLNTADDIGCQRYEFLDPSGYNNVIVKSQGGGDMKFRDENASRMKRVNTKIQRYDGLKENPLDES